ncbi:MAG: hypothetical protein ACI9XR_000877 [Flavobacterium sp.]|jgi:hypothetical protein
MKHKLLFKDYLKTFMLLAFFAFGQVGFGQVWNYDFGTGSGLFASSTSSTSFLPSPTSGTSRVRVGNNPGSIVLTNPGISLGTNSEMQIKSNTNSTSTTKMSIYDYTASKVGYAKFKIAFNGGSNGVYNFTMGDGSTFSDNNPMNTAQLFAGIQFTFGTSNSVSYAVLNNITYSSAGITNPTTLFSQSTSNEYLIEVYINNNTASNNYFKNGSNLLPNATWDLWVNGVKVGSNLAKGGLLVNSNIDSFAFNHQASSTSPGTLYIDDIEYSNALPATPSLITWNGSNGIWSNPANWTPASVPDGTIDVLIASGIPILDVDFTVGSGKTLTVSGTGSLTVNPTRTLTVAGSAAFNARPITFKSDLTGTGAFGTVTTPSNVTGATNVTVERYLTGRRAFRFLTPSITTTTSIFTNWQNAGANTAGIGTHITGSTTGANGFDVTTTGNPSMFTYNAQATGTTSGFTPITNTDVNTLTAGIGYRLLVRGDRNVDLTAASADNMNVPTTLSARGTLTVGNVTFDSTTGPALVNNQAGNTQTNGYTLIGNPYASPVDWHTVTKTGVANNAYYTWDPRLGTAAQRGRYVVYTVDGNGVGNTNVLLPSDGTLVTSDRQYLQTGQAVFIKNAVLATSATLTFSESNKATNSQYVFRSNSSALITGNSSLYLTVYDSNELAIGGNAIDGAAALFGTDYVTTLDNSDVEKLVASGENVAFVRENKNLAIETVAPAQVNDILFVKIIAFQANKNYSFKVKTTNFDTAVTAKMVDLYLNTQTAIDLTQPSFVTFATTADAGSYGSDRFKIVFNSAALGNDSFTKNTISVYPNPIVNNEFTIALPSSVTGTVNVSITNMLGQEVYKATSDATPTMQIQPKQQLQEGIYVVSVSNNGNVMQTKVIVKK